MTKIRIGCSALTGTIYAGSVAKTGLWEKNKVDVTDEAIRSVAESLLHTNQVLQFNYKGEWYEIGVRKIKGGKQ